MNKSNLIFEIKNFITEALRGWIYPIIFSAISATLGKMEGMSFFNILVGSTIAFGASSVGILSIHTLHERTRTFGKISFSEPRFFVRRSKETNQITGISIGYILSNYAEFPIHVDTKELTTSIDGVYASKEPFRNTVITAPTKGLCWFNDHIIDICPEEKTTISATLDFTVEYYNTLGRRNTLLKSLEIEISFGDIDQAPKFHWVEIK
jgi:hypothetical protein